MEEYGIHNESCRDVSVAMHMAGDCISHIPDYLYGFVASTCNKAYLPWDRTKQFGYFCIFSRFIATFLLLFSFRNGICNGIGEIRSQLVMQEAVEVM